VQIAEANNATSASLKSQELLTQRATSNKNNQNASESIQLPTLANHSHLNANQVDPIRSVSIKEPYIKFVSKHEEKSSASIKVESVIFKGRMFAGRYTRGFKVSTGKAANNTSNNLQSN
jgi:hypothetical protein